MTQAQEEERRLEAFIHLKDSFVVLIHLLLIFLFISICFESLLDVEKHAEVYSEAYVKVYVEAYIKAYAKAYARAYIEASGS